jgi:tetratricopeptide (TPR) repeat protein
MRRGLKVYIKNSTDNLNFEIEFYKAIVDEAPDYADALMLLGEAYTRKGLYSEGLRIDKKLTNLKPNDPTVYYNQACSYSLLHMKKEALHSLKKSIDLGYTDLEHLAGDPDLTYLHDDKTFQKLLRRLGKNILDKIKKGSF